jgi:hypothetical protein
MGSHLLTLTLFYIPCSPAFEQVGASPLRVIMVESHQEISNGVVNLRMGHAAAHVVPNGQSQTIENLWIPSRFTKTQIVDTKVVTMKKHGCARGRKAVELSNAFRKMLGLPLIETDSAAFAAAHGGLVQVRPITPAEASDRVEMVKHSWRPSPEPFLARVHQALLTLGPWEGRAVAFVLGKHRGSGVFWDFSNASLIPRSGCGIGVLLRMVWVMIIVTARMIKGSRASAEDEVEYTLVFEQALPVDAEEIAVPPPKYTDEKAQPVDA